MKSKAESLQHIPASLPSAVQLQPRTEVLCVSTSSYITVRLERKEEPKNQPTVFRLSWLD